jgi:hypothetical protein
MSFQRVGNRVIFTCDHCKQEIAGGDQNVLFFRKSHFHPISCAEKGVLAVKARDHAIPQVKPVDLAPPVPEVRSIYGFPKKE